MRKRALRIRPSVWTAVIAALACLFGARRRPSNRSARMADREQPFHERAVRSVHAGSRVRARQHKPEKQHSERRSCR